MEVNAAISLAGNSAADDVADGQNRMPAALGFAQAGEGVSRLPGLGDGKHEGVFLDRCVAIPEFTGVFNFDRDVRQFLKQIFPDQSRVPTGAAGRNDDLIDRPQLRHRKVQPAELRRRLFVDDPAADRVFHGARLLEDLFQHEVGEVSPLGGFGLEFQLADLALSRIGPQIGDRELFGCQGRHVVIVQIYHLAGMRRDGVGITRQKIFSLAHPDNQRRAAPSADQHVRIVGADDRNAISANDFAQRVHHRLGERMRLAILSHDFRVVLADQMSQHFGVGGGAEVVVFQTLLEPLVVLDHSVVDDSDPAALIPMRMRVLVRRRPVRCPTGMAQANLSLHWFGGEQTGQTFVDSALPLPGHELVVLHNCQPGAVIAAIFQPPQTFDDDRGRFLFSYIADDAAHNISSLSSGRESRR